MAEVTAVGGGGRPERRLLLVRHGQTEYNLVGRMQGQLDTPLSEVGRAQAAQVARGLADWPIGTVVSSDLQRAADTARAIADASSLDVTTDPRLRETDLGEWSGRGHEEVDEAFPGARAHWRLHPRWAPPGGENRLEVSARAGAVVDELMAGDAWASGAVLIVAHGGTISALTCRLLGIPIEHYPMFGGLGNTRWCQLVARPSDMWTPNSGTPWWSGPRWFLEGWNVGVTDPSPVAVVNADEGTDTDGEPDPAEVSGGAA